jgi:hypothetical protein
MVSGLALAYETSDPLRLNPGIASGLVLGRSGGHIGRLGSRREAVDVGIPSSEVDHKTRHPLREVSDEAVRVYRGHGAP